LAKQGKLELTWVGKEHRPRLEPRVLVEDPARSYGDPSTENMLIYGDNLLALKALEQDFAGKIKCIYIDPPYNTGSAFTHYDDGLEHSIWLTMMRDRLSILWTLLRNDGSIWMTIDDNESHYLKVLCDELFGRSNFVANVVWQKRTSRENRAAIGSAHDDVLVYAKNGPNGWKHSRNRLQANEAGYGNPDNDPRGPWRSIPFNAQGFRANQMYEIVTPSGSVVKPPKGRCWGATEPVFKQFLDENRVYFPRNGTGRPRIKQFGGEEKGLVPMTWWEAELAGDNEEAKKEILALFPNDDPFLTPKPERLLRMIVEIASNEGDWVLDSFAGSGTTGAVAHKMGRCWIMVELGEHCHTHIIPRMKKVIDGDDPGGITEAVGWKRGGGFRYYRLAETLLVRDRDLSANRHPVYIINPRYDERMLIRAICKIERFRYRNEGRLHGISSESRFLHVTTLLLTQAYLDSLSEDVGAEQSLLIYCTRRRRGLDVPDNVDIKKIPRDLLAKCDFEDER
jgi:adenine-specific DNA-methyltransferase